VAFVTSVAAQGAPIRGRVGVASVSGPGAKAVERATANVLAERGFRVVAVDSTDVGGVRAEAEQLKLRAVVVARVTRQKRRHTARIIARSGDAAPLGQATFSARSPRALVRAVERGLWPRLGHVLAPAADPLATTPLQP
jgi:hypothetical protein